MTNRSRAGGCAGSHYLFLTQKERDVETGLDYFEERYFSSIQGRFTTVDPENAGAALRHPQSWNGYAYSLNNPVRFIGPDGLRWAQVAVDGGIQYQWFDDEKKDDNGQTAYDRAIAGGWSAVVFDKSGNLSFTNGLMAPGETLTTVTLNENSENPSISTHTITLREWLKWYTVNAFLDPITGGNRAQGQLDDFLSSIVGTQTHGSLPSGPLVPGPAVAPWRNVTPSRPLDKMGHASKHLKDFRQIDPSLTEQDVAKSLEHVRQTGASSATKFGGKAFEGAVNIGCTSVTVKVIESAGGVIKTGYPVQ